MIRLVVVLLLLLPRLALAEVLTSTSCTASVTTGCFTRNTSGFASVFVDVSGTWTGSLVFEAAGSSTGPWRTTRAYALDGSGAYASIVTTNGAWSVITGGAPFFRARATALTAGSITLTAQASTFNVPADVVRVAGDDFGQPVMVLSTPDGGLPVAVDAPVRVVGPTFGNVQVSGTVDLSSATLASMGNYLCTTAESHRLSLGTTPVVIPTEAPIANRTSWTLINQDSVKKVSCRVDPGDGGVPDCNTPGFGITVQPNGGHLTFPVRSTDIVRCVACTNGATVEHTEEACVAP